MGIRINTNMMSVTAQRNLTINRGSSELSSAKMSSGSRITKSADDAAGLAISENLRGLIKSSEVAQRNALDGISFIQVAEGAMSEVTSIVNRIRELSVQAASDTIGPAERIYLDREAQQLKTEIERIAQVTEYNGMHLVNGTGDMLEFQIGIKADEFTNRIMYNPSESDLTLSTLGLEGIDISTKESARDGLQNLEDSLATVSGNRAMLGALQNRMQSTINNLSSYTENLTAANSRIRDADFARETSEFARSQVMLQAGLSVLTQANAVQTQALKLLS